MIAWDGPLANEQLQETVQQHVEDIQRIHEHLVEQMQILTDLMAFIRQLHERVSALEIDKNG